MPPRPRRTFARRKRLLQSGLGALAVLVVSALVWWWARGPVFAVRPRADRNILLVTIDTLRADAIGAYGGRAITPNLDRLAAHGARFTFAHAHAVVTLVSHASVLTGRYPYEHGIRDNTGYRLAPTEPTAATRLKQRGFATGGFIGGFPLDQRFGLGIGFDVYDDRVGEVSRDAIFVLPDRPADEVVTSALKWIGTQSGRWFAWVHVFDPHLPYTPPAEWRQRFPTEPYLGEVSWTDSALGPLFDDIARQPRPTLVVVTGDHGEGLGAHGELTHGLFAYETTLRVPLIVAELGPTGGRTTRGITIDRAVRHVDVLPTLLDAAGTPGEVGISGASLLPVIDGSAVPDRPSYFEAMTANLTRGWAPLRGVVANRQKFIDLPIPELYDLVDDPEEQRNIMAIQTERGEVLMNTLKYFSVAPPGRPKEETAAVRDRLRSLGYIGGGGARPRDRYTEDDDPKRLVRIEQALQRAQEAYDAGRVPEAVEIYKQVIQTRPDTEDAYRHLAFLHWRTGRPDLAIAVLESALKQGVTQSEVRIKLGQYLVEAGRPDRAIALLEGVLGDDPDALNALGIAYAAVGRTADSMRTFKRVLEIDPTSGIAYENVGALQLRAKNMPAAEASLRRALEIDPRLPGAYTALGAVLAQTGRKPDAIDEWKRAVRLSQHEYNALYNLAVELAAAGRMDEARGYGRTFLDSAPPALHAGDLVRIRKLLDSAK